MNGRCIIPADIMIRIIQFCVLRRRELRCIHLWRYITYYKDFAFIILNILPMRWAYFKGHSMPFTRFRMVSCKRSKGRKSQSPTLAPLQPPHALVAQNSPNRFQRIRLRQNPALRSEINLPSANFWFFSPTYFFLKCFAHFGIFDHQSSYNIITRFDRFAQ